MLHNYLASLYSLNEAVRVFCNRYTPDDVELTRDDFTPSSGEELINRTMDESLDSSEDSALISNTVDFRVSSSTKSENSESSKGITSYLIEKRSFPRADFENPIGSYDGLTRPNNAIR